MFCNSSTGITNAQTGSLTVEGYDLVFATNHFGHFLLTLLLLDLVKKSSPSRIINVSSIRHTEEANLHFEKKDDQGRVYPGLRGYSKSKLAILLFTKELARRLDGTGVSVFAVHPGVVMTEMIVKLGEVWSGNMQWPKFIFYPAWIAIW